MNKVCSMCKGHRSIMGMGHMKRKCPGCKGSGVALVIQISAAKPEVKKAVVKKPAAKKKAVKKSAKK